MNSADVLKAVAQEVAVCTRCSLHHSRKLAVPGEGPSDAKIMFIGEGPGFYENEQGRPFVGPSGRYLDELLASIKLKRSDVFIGNVVKCRPPGNRDPLPEELEACREYMERQIQAINPQVIVTLGRFSMAYFLPNARIGEIHGQAVNVKGRLIVPMYHPAAALRQNSLRSTIEADFARLPEFIARRLEKRSGVGGESGPGAPAQLGADEIQTDKAEPGLPIEQPELFPNEKLETPLREEPKQLKLF